MDKVAELVEEMEGRVMARGFWDELEKVAAGRGALIGAGLGAGLGAGAAALQRSGWNTRRAERKAKELEALSKIKPSLLRQAKALEAKHKVDIHKVIKKHPKAHSILNALVGGGAGAAIGALR